MWVGLVNEAVNRTSSQQPDPQYVDGVALHTECLAELGACTASRAPLPCAELCLCKHLSPAAAASLGDALFHCQPPCHICCLCRLALLSLPFPPLHFPGFVKDFHRRPYRRHLETAKSLLRPWSTAPGSGVLWAEGPSGLFA
jgi:hypothetical protein